MRAPTLHLSDQLVEIAIEERLKRRDRWHIAWETNSLTREDWKAWVKQFGFFARTFPRWLANVMSNCPILEVRQQLITNMFDEEVRDSLVGDYHYNFLRRMGRSLGLTDEEIDNAKAFPTTVAAINAWNSVFGMPR
jgi:pyrroloquinoline quinone (PQQ) biosynthesis protein C